MKYLHNILFILLFAVSISCNEFINLTGVFTNRLNITNDISSNLVVIIINEDKNIVPNIQINIIQSSDSVNIFNSKFTSRNEPLIFTFPDEQITQFDPETKKLLVIAYHPLIGSFSQEVELQKLEDNKMVRLDFNIGNVPDTMTFAPFYQYLHFKSY